MTPGQVERALEVFDAVLKIAAANRWRVKVSPRPDRPPRQHRRKGPFLAHATELDIDGFLVEISLAERLRQSRRPPRPDERHLWSVRLHPEGLVEEYLSTGLFLFHIHGLEGTGHRQCWEGRPELPLLDQLSDIARGLAAAPTILQARAEKQEALRRARRDEERRREAAREAARQADQQRRAEEQRVRHLLALAEDHRQAGEIRALVGALRTSEAASEPDMVEWLAWAVATAERLEPVATPSRCLQDSAEDS